MLRDEVRRTSRSGEAVEAADVLNAESITRCQSLWQGKNELLQSSVHIDRDLFVRR